MKRCVLALVLLGCSPGTLSEQEKLEFEDELGKLYGSDDDPNDSPADSPPTLTNCMKSVFSGCAAQSCHSGAFAPDMRGGNDALEGIMAATSTCSALPKYIDLTNPGDSLILRKVLGTQPDGCGADMPWVQGGAPELTSSERKCVEDWFNAL